jgi:hypothetical protein
MAGPAASSSPARACLRARDQHGADPVHPAPRAGPPPEFAARIRAIENIPVVCVVLKLRRRLTENFWMNISDQSIEVPGVIEYSNLNPGAGPAIVYAPFYMPKSHPKFARHNDEFIEEVLGYLPRLNPEFRRDWVMATHCHRYEFAQTVSPPGFFAMLRAHADRRPVHGRHVVLLPGRPVDFGECCRGKTVGATRTGADGLMHTAP